MEIRSIASAVTLRATLIVFGVLVALRFLWIAHQIFVIAFLGVLLGLAVARAVDWLERIHIRRGIGAPIVVALSLGVIIGIGTLIAPSIQSQSKDLRQQLPKAIRAIEAWINRTPAAAAVMNGTPLTNLGGGAPSGSEQEPQSVSGSESTSPPAQAGRPPSGAQRSTAASGESADEGSGPDRITQELQGVVRFLFPALTSAFTAIGGLIIILFIAMYVAAEPGLYRKGLLHLIPHNRRERAEETLDTLRDTLRQWLIARLIAMVAVGLITGAGLALLQVPGAAALALLAALLEFIPFFGPVMSALPAIAVAFATSPEKGIYVLILYLIIQQLEGNVITPLLLQRRLDIPPAMTVLAVAAMGVVFGVVGMLIAEPLLAAVLVTTKLLYVQDVVGDEIRIGKEA